MVLKSLKVLKIILVIFVIAVFIILILSNGKIYSKDELSYGVTFSKKHALSLDLDWKNLYLSILDDLGVKKIRLPAYWDEVEKINNGYDYSDLDWQIDEAGKRNAGIILAVGGRLPRWPECHLPEWTENLDKETRENETFEYIENTINRYKNRENIIGWQIENEYFLTKFGECPNFGPAFLDKEIELVKKLDPERPIIVTDSGELSLWVPAAKRADIFGTSLYLNTYSSFLKSYVHYPITPRFFHFKRNVASWFAHPDKWIVIELQAEPWGPIPYQYMTERDRDRTMDLKKFKEIIDFSYKAGFNEFYLWGAEWWWWEKNNNNNPFIWEEARKIFN